MFEYLLIFSSWVTSALLVALAWFVYKYSTCYMATENYWKYIYAGLLFFAASEIMRPMYFYGDSYFFAYLALSVIGASLLAYGFYGLYEAERV